MLHVRVWAQVLPCHRGSTAWAGRVMGAGEFPKQPPSASFFTFSFLKIAPAQACHSKQGPGLSHSPTFQPDQERSGSGSVMAQLSPSGIHSLSGCTPPLGVCHFVLIPPCDFKQPGLSRCCSNLVWQGRKPLTWLSPKNPATDLVCMGPGAAATLVPVLDPGTLLP